MRLGIVPQACDNAYVCNPNTSMPLFGKNKILTDAEIDKITDFVYGL
jgi:sulfur-oxidizing protein SoxX